MVNVAAVVVFGGGGVVVVCARLNRHLGKERIKGLRRAGCDEGRWERAWRQGLHTCGQAGRHRGAAWGDLAEAHVWRACLPAKVIGCRPVFARSAHHVVSLLFVHALPGPARLALLARALT